MVTFKGGISRGIRNVEYAKATKVYCMGFVSEVMPRGIETTDLDFGWSANGQTVDDHGKRFLSWEFKTLGSGITTGQTRYIRNRLLADADKHWMFIVLHQPVDADLVRLEEMVGFHLLGYAKNNWQFSVCKQHRPRKAVVDLSQRLVIEWFKGERQFRDSALELLDWYPAGTNWKHFLGTLDEDNGT